MRRAMNDTLPCTFEPVTVNQVFDRLHTTVGRNPRAECHSNAGIYLRGFRRPGSDKFTRSEAHAWLWIPHDEARAGSTLHPAGIRRTRYFDL